MVNADKNSNNTNKKVVILLLLKLFDSLSWDWYLFPRKAYLKIQRYVIKVGKCRKVALGLDWLSFSLLLCFFFLYIVSHVTFIFCSRIQLLAVLYLYLYFLYYKNSSFSIDYILLY